MRTPAYFISPKGEIIYCGVKHITKILQDPKKFGMDQAMIEYLHDFYNERIGQEGKAREQILISLINQGWIRIRKYGDKFWTVNVNKITRKVKQYLSKWAKEMLKGRDGIKEYDPQIPVKIDSPNVRVQTSDISAVAASDSFILEGDEEYEVKWIKSLDEMEDLPLYECFNELQEKLMKHQLNESSLSRIQRMYFQHDTGTITAFRGFHDCGDGEKIALKENKKRNSILKSKLLSRGYGITRVKGAWMENGGIEKGEVSFFVVDLKDTGKLKKDLIELGKQFDQDAITYAKAEGDYYAISTNECPMAWPGSGRVGVESKLGKPVFGKTGVNGYSRVGGRAFVFEEKDLTELFDYYPTEIRSIKNIDISYPNKKSIVENLK